MTRELAGDQIGELRAPLVSILLPTFNQAAFVRDAVEAALAQSYTPLEILVSDDCSSDETYEIVRKLVDGYQGPHDVRIFRNEVNLGIGAHVNRLLSLSRGEFIVLAAGDDVSHPERVERVVDHWRAAGPGVNAVFSNLEVIDDGGRTRGNLFDSKPRFAQTLDEFKRGVPCWVVGAGFAFDRELYTTYGALDPAIRQEDGCLAFRALLKGRIAYLDAPVVQYRHHGGNVSQSVDPRRRLALQRAEHRMKEAWLKDALMTHSADRPLIRMLRRTYHWSRARGILFSVWPIGILYNWLRVSAKRACDGLRSQPGRAAEGV